MDALTRPNIPRALPSGTRQGAGLPGPFSGVQGNSVPLAGGLGDSVPHQPRRVAVAVSGGRDSLLALALLVETYGPDNVIAIHGLFIREADQRLCADLERVCALLSVRLVVADVRDRFEEAVIRPFVAEYAAGRTPNPCALCNREVKFGLLLDEARGHGASHIATGHYARLEHGPERTALFCGADPAKDQSYFLSLVPERALACAIFPLGERYKRDTMAALQERGLTPPAPGESQEVCFVPDDDYVAFIEARQPELCDAGPIELPSGERLGTHGGLHRYTPGQRRGIGVAYAEPLYVLGKDQPRNALIVGSKELTTAASCTARQVNLLVPPTEWPEKTLVKTRYRQQAAPARVSYGQDRLDIRFDTPRSLPAAGQVAAVYDASGRVLAGGIITTETPA
ncbi:tRNA 2-thiouridine(34) synthase MnmA [Oceanidesulfovibrio marinus]|uniref:tRNA-specific 2-thiouridylase MnmA n=1 Tax=Oceanidesulfovibrio marinus TaxID=370038 RepID=A0ABX6NMF9_9BACT|nr:tRNA 2-thiouridine(34) synthase MnmA [Oceanidesulfovibrio marinus]